MNILGSMVTVLADMGDHDGMGGGWWWLWGTLMIVAVIATIGGLVWLISQSTRGREPHVHDRAREILAERLARGEITPDEYRERSSQLA